MIANEEEATKALLGHNASKYQMINDFVSSTNLRVLKTHIEMQN